MRTFGVLLGSIGAALLVSCASNPEAVYRNRAGMTYLQDGKYSQAETEFAAASKLDERSALYKSNLGVARLRLERYEEAKALFQEAIALDATKALYHRNLGEVYLSEGQVDAALSEYQRALSLAPAEVGQRGLIMAIAFDTGTVDRWAKQFDDDVRNTSPDNKDGVNVVYLSEQAILFGLQLQGKYDEVIARASADIDAIRGVKTEYGGYVIPIITPFFFYIVSVPKSNISVKPIVAALYNARGSAYARKGMYKEAIADLKLSVENAPTGFGSITLGIVQLHSGDAGEATYQLRRTLETNREVVVAKVYYAAALKASGDRVAAENQRTAARSAMERVERRRLKHDFDILEAMAFLDQVWEEYDGAIEKYERVLGICATCGWSARNLGEIYLKRGDKAKAESYLQKAAALMPGDSRTKEAAK